ncbi:hypothetical protein CLG96_03160 [Sphingomonas oleivorans]|uniref:O-antigen ligase-related domain-containing protein n=1 Tax=Sphingomonas oleivorans TaxID=1735121 RepID=A0A2T5G1W8_9SPHN|nr:O-antigen ligase family protein [Sphingomonas oleivorans]PTQ13144.1 hypothetical protein CLG96_03160 [Sphingomonas oleivorans]
MIRAPWIALLLTLSLLALPFGGYRPWAWSLAGLVIALLLLGWAWLAAARRVPIVWRGMLWPAVIGYFVVVIWVLLQAITTPVQGWAHPLWTIAGTALGRPLAASVTIAPQDGLASLIRLLTFGGIFWLALQFGRDRDRAFQLLRWIGISSGAYALYGLINYIAGNRLLLWYERWAYLDDVTGTFVNRNSYATFAGLGLLTVFALTIHLFRRNWRYADPSLSRIGRFFEALRGAPALFGTLLIVIAMAWLQSHSRMGFAATAIGLLTLILVGRAIVTLRARLIALIISLLAALPLVGSSGDGLLDRLEGTDGIDRLPLFELTRRMIDSAPWTGQGYGGFASLLPLYRDMTLPGRQTFTLAHNSYLELAAELGLPAAAMLAAVIVWLALLCLVGAYRRNRDSVFPSLAFAASVLVGVHALTDFSIQIPAVGCLYAALLGVGNAQAWTGGASAGSSAAADMVSRLRFLLPLKSSTAK